jgi:hypothetical protein
MKFYILRIKGMRHRFRKLQELSNVSCETAMNIEIRKCICPLLVNTPYLLPIAFYAVIPRSLIATPLLNKSPDSIQPGVLIQCSARSPVRNIGNQMNAIQKVPHFCSKIYFNIILQSISISPKWPLPSVF